MPMAAVIVGMVVPMLDFAGQAMMVVVMVTVDGKSVGYLRAEQCLIFRVPAHRLGLTFATDMLIEAKDVIGLRHHQVKVV